MVANYGKTVATVYDATHGFQINIFRNPVLHKLAAEAGLYRNLQYFKQFPDSNIAKVSINLLKESKRVISILFLFSISE
jgi:hypothetical protein